MSFCLCAFNTSNVNANVNVNASSNVNMFVHIEGSFIIIDFSKWRRLYRKMS